MFAFLLASFPARNADLWLHLAAGRQGLSANLADTATRHTWLYDLLTFWVYSAFGGTGLVLGKALLVVALALVLMRLSRPAGESWLLPAVCTALALLTASTRLLVQPATLSCFLLALTFFLLQRGKRPVHPDGVGLAARPPTPTLPSLVPPWPLAVLLVLWVNLDGWFLLGLMLVALVWLGQALDDAAGGDRVRVLVRRAGSLASLAAVCLLNPLVWHAFALPPELDWVGGQGGAVGPGPATSPFQEGYYKAFGTSPAVLAYFPLLGLSLLSFLLDLPRWRWQRFLPWAALAALTVVQVRVIPFFAVVAGPVLAWNLQEFFADRYDPARWENPIWRRGFIALRGLAVLLGLGFLVCAWPGWLQAPPYEPRRWAIETAPSLERGAAAVCRWHQDGRFGPDARALHLSPDSVAAFAWFCPEDRALLDEPLMAAVVNPTSDSGAWQNQLRAAGVNHVVVYDQDRGRLFAVLNRLLAEPEQWPLLFAEGDLAVFGWRDPQTATDPFRGLEVNLERLAFRPAEGQQAPPQGPESAWEARRWWEAFWKPAPPPPLDRQEATLHLLHAEALRPLAPLQHLAAWEGSQTAGLVGAAAGWLGPGGMFDASARLTLWRPNLPADGSGSDNLPGLDRFALAWQRAFTYQREDTPAALLFLAVRAARRALAANPGDAQAHLVLGQAYLLLLRGTRERAWSRQIAELGQLRRVQASTALNQALALNPDLEQAHLGLASLYHELGYLDLERDHLGAYLRLTREKDGKPAAGDPETRTRQEKALAALTQIVADREKALTAETAGVRVLDRARLAVRKGLAAKARDLLLESDVSAFGPQGMALELDLLLNTGRAGDVREWLTPEHEASLGASAYWWLEVLAQAAGGDYAAAKAACSRLAGVERKPGTPTLREAMALVIGQTMAEEATPDGSLPSITIRALRWGGLYNRVGNLARSLTQEADADVLRGLLALEEGDVGQAAAAFRTAVALWHSAAAAAAGAGLDFHGRQAAQGYLALLEEVSR